MPAACATPANVTGAPARSSSRSALDGPGLLLAHDAGRRLRTAGQDAPADASFSRSLVLERRDDLVQVARDLLVISATRAWPAASAAEIDLQRACAGHGAAAGTPPWSRTSGKSGSCSRCGQVLTRGSLAVALGSAWVARDSCLLRPGRVAERPSGLIRTGWPSALTFAAPFPVLTHGLIRTAAHSERS